MEHRTVDRVRTEVEQLDLRRTCDHFLWSLWYDSRDATALQNRILVHTRVPWLRKASRVRSGDGIGRRIQLESRAASRRSPYRQQVSST